jgi:hypothetical protein
MKSCWITPISPGLVSSDDARVGKLSSRSLHRSKRASDELTLSTRLNSGGVLNATIVWEPKAQDALNSGLHDYHEMGP